MTDIFKDFMEGYLRRFVDEVREAPEVQVAEISTPRRPLRDPRIEQRLLLAPVEPAPPRRQKLH